ncbi:MAG: hypothetical protein R3208_09135 [Ketobacteraceae bacterium]|nr:hypothetical protein [Ketobacteraceae bacterium]
MTASLGYILRCIVCIVFPLFVYACGGSGRTDTTEPAPPASLADSTDSSDQKASDDEGAARRHQTGQVYVQFGPEFPSRPARRVVELLNQTLPHDVRLLSEQALPDPDGIYLLLGNTALAQHYWPGGTGLTEPESYLIRSTQGPDGQRLFWAAGLPGGSASLLPDTNIGHLYAAYHLLELAGFHFLHPLEPVTPSHIDWPETIEINEAPRWPIRTWHLHTQHPLELTHVLNGWGPEGVDDVQGWEALLAEWDLFLEWAVANKQNRVEWFLLMADSWQAFADSAERQSRLHRLVDMAHQWGLAVGIDAPIAFKQQHAWTMLREKGNETAQIQQAIDWLNQAGFDYFEVEAGFSEFTHPSDFQMIAWMDEVARYADETYGKPAYVKVHCTRSQYASSFVDPETGEALNFNFLPYYADSRMGVLPHTVQYYDLEGPAFTYDNESFAFMRRYMQLEAGRREVLYYPETAYWVSYDIDVPLFLPVYMDRRLYDLRLIASDEEQGRMGRGEYAGSRIQGQVNFSSGWEWGYWMNDVVTARAAWNPLLHVPDQTAALALALQPVVAPLGDASREAAAVLIDWIDAQNRLFIHGEVGGIRPETPYLRTAQAYLQGWEAWDDVNKTIGMLETQPRKMGMLDMLNPLAPRKNKVDYDTVLRPLLEATATELARLYGRFTELESRVHSDGLALYEEIRDAMEITVRRAEQVFHLYETAANIHPVILNADKTQANIHLNKARRALDRAVEVVGQREPRYRVDAERIAGWNYNPTAYHFGYLWSVRSLHYWWRDEGKIVDRPTSPGYLNIMDPVDIANGEGEWVEWIFNLTSLRDWLTSLLGEQSYFSELFYEPDTEPRYPQDDLRSRPHWYVPLSE